MNYAGTGAVNTVLNLQQIQVEQGYAGGVIGYAGTASAGGILDTTLGIGDYLPFSIQDVTVQEKRPDTVSLQKEITQEEQSDRGSVEISRM